MLTGSWPSPAGGDEFALSFDQQRDKRVLVIPALFDESNKLRHFTVEVMRRLDTGGVDSMLPDLPGTNESLAPLTEQTVSGWRAAVEAAASHFKATHVLTLRGGTLLDPGTLPGLRYASVGGTALLRGLVRVQLLSDKEADLTTTRDELVARAESQGAQLAGYDLGPAMVRELAEAEAPDGPATEVKQAEMGGAGLWLRAEPAFDADQADALAALMLEQVG
ncbi:hypothetical protein [Aurantiacibacter gilvus]|uniref:Uncharacterized protein n=1 Tax=Aurantiacibacter gilvus TaxID=3139141 RepID=A0ABU9ICH5_9SPHN